MEEKHAHVATKNAGRIARPVASTEPSYDELSVLRTDLVQKISSVVGECHVAPQDGQELTDVVQAYNASLKELRTIREDAVGFIELLCGRHFVHDDQHVSGTRQSVKTASDVATTAGKPRDFLTLNPIRVSVNLEPGLFGLSVLEGARQLQADLRQSVEDFVANFLEIMDRLVELRVVGTIDWPVPTACRFRFFHVKLETVKDTHVTGISSRNGRDWKQTYRQTETAHTLHGEQQHLAQARRTELPAYQQTMPIRVRELCDQIPIWLEERIDVVDGDLFRCDTVQKHLKTEQHSEFVEETKLPYVFDPAITLGPFVLASWLSDEVDAERHRAQQQAHSRRQEVEQQQDLAKQQSYRPPVIAASLQLIPFALQLLALAFWPSLYWGVLGLALLLVIPCLFMMRGVAIAHGVRPDATLYLIVAGAAALAVLGLHVIVLAASYQTFSLLLLGVCLVGVSVFLAREFVTLLRAGG